MICQNWGIFDSWVKAAVDEDSCLYQQTQMLGIIADVKLQVWNSRYDMIDLKDWKVLAQVQGA